MQRIIRIFTQIDRFLVYFGLPYTHAHIAIYRIIVSREIRSGDILVPQQLMRQVFEQNKERIQHVALIGRVINTYDQSHYSHPDI